MVARYLDYNARDVLPFVQVPREDQLQSELVGPAGEADADTRLEIERLSGPVDYPVELVCLFAGGMEILHGAEVCVLLDGQSPPGPEVVRDAGRRCEHKVS